MFNTVFDELGYTCVVARAEVGVFCDPFEVFVKNFIQASCVF